jgi:O-antigen/teichoic acid export membrane protein
MHAFSRRADGFIISKLLGAGPLGVYTLASEIAAMPVELLVMPIRRALLPGYARLSKEIEQLRALFFDGFVLTLLLVIPLAVGMALTADSIVRLVLGSRWLEAIPLIQTLAFLGCFRACSSNIVPLYLALGRPELVMRTTMITVAIGLPLVVAGVYVGGIGGAAYAVTLAGALNVVVAFALAASSLRLSSRKLWAPVTRTVVAAAAMSVLVLGIDRSFGAPETAFSLLAQFLTQVLAGAAAFSIAHWLLWRLWGSPRGPESQIVSASRGLLARLQA